jgi:cell filamentation protein
MTWSSRKFDERHVADPYCLADSSCLRNRLGITDAKELRAVEARIVAVRDVEILRTTLPGEYNLEHLKSFHRRLFGDVYDWAGETRTVDIGKPGVHFAHWRLVDECLSSVLGQLAADGYLIGRTRQSIVERLAYYYAEINAVHPFREGNGRTQRTFLRQLVAAAGWRIDWSGLNQQENIDASRRSLQTTETEPLQRLFEPLISQI